jgi:hypothetical protein
MGVAKIAAGDVLKFLGKLTYPEKCPFAAASTNKFFVAERYQEFLMFAEIRICVYYLIAVYFVWLCVRLKFIKIAYVNSPHFLAIFQTKNSEFAIFKIFFDVR